MPISIFSDEWRECLIAHYTTVARASDQRTERTLRYVMLDAGFTDDDLRRMYLTATVHVDDVGADFAPDPQIIEPVMVAVAAVPEPPSTEDLLDELDESSELLPLAEEILAEASLDETELEDEPTDEPPAEEADEPPLPPDPDSTQLSLF